MRVGADTTGVVGKAKQATAVVILGLDDVGARRHQIEVTVAAWLWAVACGVSRVLEVEVVAAAMMAVEAIAAVASSVAKVAVAKS